MRPTLLLAALLVATPAVAVPVALTQQGALQDATGAPLVGAHVFQVSIYADASGGTPLWTSNVPVDLDDGLYSIILGGSGGTPLDSAIFDGSVRYLGLAVDTEPELPRLPIVSVPYALVAGSAGSADSVAWSNVTGLPADLDDGDDDLLASMACDEGEVPTWRGSDWACETATPSSLDANTLTGTIDIARLPVGGGENDVAAGDHSHSFGQISGVAALGQLPTGTSGDTVALGDHGHALADLSGDLPMSRVTGDLPITRVTGDLPMSRVTGDLPTSRVTGNLPIDRIEGNIPFARLPVGTTATTVAQGDHKHSAADLTSGTLDPARLPANLAVSGTLTAGGYVRFGASTATCSSSIEGAVRWNNAAQSLDLCVNGAWTPFAGSLVGSQQRPGKSCADILAKGGSQGNGLYWVDPASSGSAFQTVCDMTTDGGGWTVCARQNFSANDRFLGRSQLGSAWGVVSESGDRWGVNCAWMMKQVASGQNVEWMLKGSSGEWQWVYPFHVDDFYDRVTGSLDNTCESRSSATVTQCKGSATSGTVSISKKFACHNTGGHRTSDNYFIFQIADSTNSNVVMEMGQGDANHPVGIRPDCGTTGWWGGCGRLGSSFPYQSSNYCGSGREYGAVSAAFRER